MTNVAINECIMIEGNQYIRISQNLVYFKGIRSRKNIDCPVFPIGCEVLSIAKEHGNVLTCLSNGTGILAKNTNSLAKTRLMRDYEKYHYLLINNWDAFYYFSGSFNDAPSQRVYQIREGKVVRLSERRTYEIVNSAVSHNYFSNLKDAYARIVIGGWGGVSSPHRTQDYVNREFDIMLSRYYGIGIDYDFQIPVGKDKILVEAYLKGEFIDA